MREDKIPKDKNLNIHLKKLKTEEQIKLQEYGRK